MILRAKLTSGKGYYYQNLDPSEEGHGGERPPEGYCVGPDDVVGLGMVLANGTQDIPNVTYCASYYFQPMYIVVAILIWYFFLKGKI